MQDQQIVNSVVDSIEKLVTNSTNSITSGIEQYGPVVVNTAEHYIQVLAIIHSILYVIGIVACLIIAKNTLRTARKYLKIDKFMPGTTDNDLYSCFNFVVCFAAIMVAIVIISMLVDIDNILSVISPKLELIKMSKDALVAKLAK